MKLVKNRPSSGFFKRKRLLVNSGFQWKYTLILVFGIGIMSLLVGGVSFYFIRQNYFVFIDLAYENAPALVSNLEVERDWIANLYIFSLVGVLLFSLSLGLKLTYGIAGPLIVIKKHLLRLAQGDFHQPEVRVRHSEDYQELVNAYNYFYKSIQTQTEKELNCLEAIQDNQNLDEVKSSIEKIIQIKKEQLNGEISLEPETTHDSHHAS